MADHLPGSMIDNLQRCSTIGYLCEMILSMLALEPGSLEGAGQEGWYTLFAHASNCTKISDTVVCRELANQKRDTVHVQYLKD